VSNPDVIVVGSGASATSAALPLVRAGRSVLMLDVGNRDTRYAPLIAPAPFSSLRQTDEGQHRYFLGDAFEGVPLGQARAGTTLTPPRQFIHRDTHRHTPLCSEGFFAFESLALGGLGSGWGAVAVQFDDHDLADFPIKHRDLAAHYASVSARIGLSGARDDLLPYYGDCASLQPALDLDSNARLIYQRYERKRERLNGAGFFLGRARLAALSRDLGDRKGHAYHDMDFYADNGRSVFRPWYTVEELGAYANFRYVSPYLVNRFRELPANSGVEVEAVDLTLGRREYFRSRCLVLAAGTLGTARIVLRSLGGYGTRVPLVANANSWWPCLHLAMLGKPADDRRHSLTQLAIVFDPGHCGRIPVHAQTYSYRSLLLFKLVKEVPLAVPEAFGILRELVNAFVVVNFFHEDRPSPDKYCALRRGESGQPDVLEIRCTIDREVQRRQVRTEKALLRQFRRLGCWPVKRISPGYGSSIHYGGTVPMTVEERELTVTPECRLRGTRAVYLVDGSVLPYMPAKALTLTLMANAERVATLLNGELARTCVAA